MAGEARGCLEIDRNRERSTQGQWRQTSEAMGDIVSSAAQVTQHRDAQPAGRPRTEERRAPPLGETAGLLSSHLGLDMEHAGLVRARRFRETTLTLHHPAAGDWLWRSPTAERPKIVIAMSIDSELSYSSSASRLEAPAQNAAGVLFRGACAGRTTWNGTSRAVVLWSSVAWTGGVHADPVPLLASHLLTACRSFIVELMGESRGNSGLQSPTIERILGEMAVGITREHDVTTGETDAMSGSLVERSRAVILAQRSDPNFGIADIALALHVSARHLQRAFAAVDSTPFNELRSARVELAAQTLSDMTYRGFPVDSIAQRCGFPSAAALRRAFAAEQMPSPAALRRAAVPAQAIASTAPITR